MHDDADNDHDYDDDGDDGNIKVHRGAKSLLSIKLYKFTLANVFKIMAEYIPLIAIAEK